MAGGNSGTLRLGTGVPMFGTSLSSMASIFLNFFLGSGSILGHFLVGAALRVLCDRLVAAATPGSRLGSLVLFLCLGTGLVFFLFP